MKAKAKAILLIALICSVSLAISDDEYTKYLGKNVTVNVCNTTVFQGMMTENWPDSIVVKELCDPELGNVTLRKSCIISITEGFLCIT